jgi:methylmalonyl-CoA epimerase
MVDPQFPRVPELGLGDVVERLDHVAFGVGDLEAAGAFARLIGGVFFEGADSPSNGFRWVQFRMPGGAKLELIAPTADDSFLIPFLEKRGDGLHHLTLKVTDMDEAVSRAEAAGQRVVGRNRLGNNWEEAFLHPSTAHGAVIQLAVWDDAIPAGSDDWDAVMRGEVIEST